LVGAWSTKAVPASIRPSSESNFGLHTDWAVVAAGSAAIETAGNNRDIKQAENLNMGMNA
jgi:hypothetical protein